MLGEVNFVKRLVEFDKDNISDKVARNIKRIIEDPSFTPDQVRDLGLGVPASTLVWGRGPTLAVTQVWGEGLDQPGSCRGGRDWLLRTPCS